MKNASVDTCTSLHQKEIIKSILDGIICAFHEHNYTVDEQVSSVLCQQLGISSEEDDGQLFSLA